MPTWLAVALGTLAAAVSVALGSGFTVDDALISTRIADHLAAGHGYRFNVGGDITDSVTPLGWANWLSLFSQGNSFHTLHAARAFGVLCALMTGAQLGLLLRQIGVRRLDAAMLLVPLALSLPFGAWSQSGMETTPVALLVTSALVAIERGRYSLALLLSGVAGALRPELIPWGFTLSILLPADARWERPLRGLLALAPPGLVACLRLALFGAAAPLAVYAKPADSWQGLVYVLSGVALVGLPMLCVGFKGWTRVPARAAVVGIATAAELFGLVAAGGDWMALFRLLVPLLPCFLYLGAHLTRSTNAGPAASARWATPLRAAAASATCLFVVSNSWESARGVITERQRAISDLALLLSGARIVGTVDVGWVGAATDQAVVDFAGATDEEVARLAGSHTSKRLPSDFLERRDIDTLVLLLAPGATTEETLQAWDVPWQGLSFARTVEQRITRLTGAERFVPVGHIGFGAVKGAAPGTQYTYLVLQKQAFARRSPSTGDR
ncbi:MAG: hypothetical protein RJA70_3387 [Pseudomonadota bacterium]|jgi:hypothetical protein